MKNLILSIALLATFVGRIGAAQSTSVPKPITVAIGGAQSKVVFEFLKAGAKIKHRENCEMIEVGQMSCMHNVVSESFYCWSVLSPNGSLQKFDLSKLPCIGDGPGGGAGVSN